jgi:hypothetical protein
LQRATKTRNDDAWRELAEIVWQTGEPMPAASE